MGARESALASGLSSEQANRIYALILVTMHDAIAVGRDAAVLVDVDLSILGAETARFDEYEGQIRERVFVGARTFVSPVSTADSARFSGPHEDLQRCILSRAARDRCAPEYRPFTGPLVKRVHSRPAPQQLQLRPELVFH